MNKKQRRKLIRYTTQSLVAIACAVVVYGVANTVTGVYNNPLYVILFCGGWITGLIVDMFNESNKQKQKEEEAEEKKARE